MARPIIKLVIDVSMSTETMVGAIYMFLVQMMKRAGTGCRYSLTCFSGEDRCGDKPSAETILLGEGSPLGRADQVLDALRNIRLSPGRVTTDHTVKTALEAALNADCGEGTDGESSLLLFTDHPFGRLSLKGDNLGRIHKALLFVPQEMTDRMPVEFSFVTREGTLTDNIPVCTMAAEELFTGWSEEDWNMILQFIE